MDRSGTQVLWTIIGFFIAVLSFMLASLVGAFLWLK